MRIRIDPKIAYLEFKRRHPQEIAELYKEMDGALHPTTPKTLVLYHGTTAKAARRIFQEGFNKDAKMRFGGLFGLYELGKAIYFSPIEKVANCFGRKIIKAEVTINKPFEVLPQVWGDINLKMRRLIYKILVKELKCKRPRKLRKLYSYFGNQIMEDYLQQRRIGSIFCSDHVAKYNRNLLPQRQEQWAIFNSDNIKILGMSQKTYSYIKLRTIFRLKQILTFYRRFKQ